jgi:ribosome-associated heat shock protein Hsp15
MTEAADSLRVDKWLFHARFFKSRTLAARMCEAGGLRIDGEKVSKSHYKVKAGEVLTFSQGPYIRVVKVLALGKRRGPAAEAQALYEDLNPPERQKRLPKGAAPATPKRAPGAGRPTKRERRQLDKLRGD